MQLQQSVLDCAVPMRVISFIVTLSIISNVFTSENKLIRMFTNISVPL